MPALDFATGHRAARISELMVSLNLAASFEEHCSYRDELWELGLRLRPGFYGKNWWISPETIALVREAPDSRALNDFLKELVRKERVL